MKMRSLPHSASDVASVPERSGGAEATKLVEVVGVQFRVDGGAWAAAQTDGSVFDAPHEDFTVTTDNLAPGPAVRTRLKGFGDAQDSMA